ncbi:hypothetical protein FF011L_40260 [Roseimaritima multifibrata]|uniref:Uncharacterized protein n=1 Tax=Roseimaritima multifibrata TaxID=1930274 RepID=A0A517MK30_9BACT|nr:hypothetical protein [Roseimaritima multifibrata]QDS95233.1 hypothetical protein FF011L_40260 [Roseimaritima multifibrata]
MRIPSDLHERNLYRERTHGARKTPFAMRRLFRLVLMLIVVVWVMRKAADPKIYTPFFPSRVAVPPAVSGAGHSVFVPPAVAGGVSGAVDPGSPGAAASEVPILDSADGDEGTSGGAFVNHAFEKAVDELSLPQQRQLSVWLWELRHRDHEKTEPDQAQPGRSDETFSLTELFVSPESQPANGTTDELDPETKRPIPQSLVDLSVRGRQALQAELDRTYQDRVVDGAVFRPADFDAFYRYLELASQKNFTTHFWNAKPAPRQVGVVPLMQQPKAYLGTQVWLTAQVARVVPVTVAESKANRNRFGVNEYYEVWLRPEDGTERPVVLYTPEVSAALKQIPSDSALQSGPHVAVAGIFLKRRLYAAVGGATECPVIVGRVWDQEATVADVVTAPRSEPPWMMVVALAGIFGVTLAAGLFWRSTVAAKQTRRVRQASLSMAPEFAASLAASDVRDRKLDDEVVDPQYVVKTEEDP